jgi:hypothetical protein
MIGVSASLQLLVEEFHLFSNFEQQFEQQWGNNKAEYTYGWYSTSVGINMI